MKVLITGDAGFIGAHMREAFAGHDVRGYDRSRAGEDLRFLDKASVKPDVIVHLAAVADIRHNWSESDPMRLGSNLGAVWSHNVDATLALLEACPGVPFMFASSASVYGSRSGMGAQEDMAPDIRSPYAASKIAAEGLIQAFAEKYGNPMHIFRLACVVGSGYTHGHIADFAKAGKSLRPLTNGIARRTHIHVSDVCSAFVMAATGQIPGGIYNVGAGVWGCRDTARIMGVEPEWPETGIGWTGDNQVVVRSTRLETMGWRATKSIEMGVREALASNGWAK